MIFRALKMDSAFNRTRELRVIMFQTNVMAYVLGSPVGGGSPLLMYFITLIFMNRVKSVHHI